MNTFHKYSKKNICWAVRMCVLVESQSTRMMIRNIPKYYSRCGGGHEKYSKIDWNRKRWPWWLCFFWKHRSNEWMSTRGRKRTTCHCSLIKLAPAFALLAWSLRMDENEHMLAWGVKEIIRCWSDKKMLLIWDNEVEMAICARIFFLFLRVFQ